MQTLQSSNGLKDRGSVAIVDDDLATIRRVERTLVGVGYVVLPITTPDPIEAAAVLLDSACGVAIVSLHLYGAPSGLELVRLIRRAAAPISLRFVLTTASRRDAGRHAEELQALGGSLLLKPFDDRALFAAADRSEQSHYPGAAIVERAGEPTPAPHVDRRS